MSDSLRGRYLGLGGGRRAAVMRDGTGSAIVVWMVVLGGVGKGGSGCRYQAGVGMGTVGVR